MSGSWCVWCKLSANEWKPFEHGIGDAWTIREMNELREQLNTKEVRDTSHNRKGIVEIELFECVDVVQYIYPILHSEIGLGNYILNAFLTWVDYRIEMVSEEEMEKRKLFATLIEEMEEKESDLVEFNNNGGRMLLDHKIQQAQLRKSKVARREDNSFVHTVEERKEIAQMLKGIGEEIKLLTG